MSSTDTDTIRIMVKAEHCSGPGSLVADEDRYIEVDEDGEESVSPDVWLLDDTRDGHLAYAAQLAAETGARGTYHRAVARSIYEALGVDPDDDSDD